VVRDVLEEPAGIDYLIFDLRRVLALSESAVHLLHSLLLKLAALDKSVVFTNHQHLPLLRRMMKSKLGAKFDDLFHTFGDNDHALEWCENQLLEKHADSRVIGIRTKIADYQLFKGLTASELKIVESNLKARSYKRDKEIISAGDAAREIFFLSRGVVSIYLAGEERHRLASFSPGMCFGEMAFIDGSPRSANIVADTDVECHELSRENFDKLGRSHPALKIKLLEKLCLDLTGKLRKANRELDVLE
jgi:glutaminase